MEKLTQTIETLGLPFVGYKMTDRKIDQHLHDRVIAETYGDLPSYFFKMCTDEDEFLFRVADEFKNVLNGALKEKKVQWKISKLDVCQSDKIISAGRYIFHGTSDYGEVRSVMNSLDWDAIALSVQEGVDGYDESKDGADVTAWIELKDEVYGHPLDERWVKLWANDAEFDQVFWSAYEKTDLMQWRGYAYQNHWTTNAHAPRALDFICWAIMTQDYDEFMALIGDDKQTNAKTGIDLFDTLTTTTSKTNITTSTTMEKTKELQTENKTVALTATSAVTEAEQTRFFKDALAIPQVAASEKEWSREGATFQKIVLFAKDIDTTFTCDTTPLKSGERKGKPSLSREQWTVNEGEKYSWKGVNGAVQGFKCYAVRDYMGMAQYMESGSAKKWLAKLNEDVQETTQTAPTPAPQTENKKCQPKATRQSVDCKEKVRTFQGNTYSLPGNECVMLHLVTMQDGSVRGIQFNTTINAVEFDGSYDAKSMAQFVNNNGCKQIATPKCMWKALAELGFETKSEKAEPTPESKPEPAPVKTLDSKPHPKKKEQPKVEEPKAEQTPAPKADRVTIDKRDGGLFIGGADADIEMLIRSYVDAINAMQMRKIG